MKKTFLALVFATVFTACNSGAKEEVSTVDTTAAVVTAVDTTSAVSVATESVAAAATK